MDLRRFLDLFEAESQEHIRLLHRGLLALEQGVPGAVDEAFRAAHTLKGLSAAMGQTTAAERAHRLEDRLDAIRTGAAAPDPAAIDELLRNADALEHAIVDAIARGLPHVEQEPAPAAPPAPAAAAPSAPAPSGTTAVLRVQLAPDAPIPAARAMLIMRGLDAVTGVIGSDPAAFDEHFPGVFSVFLGAGADAADVQSRILAAGEVQSVEALPVGVVPEVPSASATAGTTATPPAGASRQQLRVDARRLDDVADGVAELAVTLTRLAGDGAGDFTLSSEAGMLLDRANTLMTTLQRDVLALRLVPIREAFERLPRAVRDAARRLERDVELVIAGEDVELDRTIVAEISEPLVHLLRNAVGHGIEDPAERSAAGKPERGTVRVGAMREGTQVVISVQDDGRGVDRQAVLNRAREARLVAADAALPTDDELLRLISHPGLSTARAVDELSGRGVGVDAVVSSIRALGGTVELSTQPGRGTCFMIRLPVSRALVPALRVRVGSEDYAIPLTMVAEAVELENPAHAGDGVETVQVRGERLPLVRLRSVLHAEGSGRETAAVVSGTGERRAALAVDELVGRENILVRPFAPAPGMLPCFSGATLLPDGRPALVLDPLSVI